MEVIDCCLNSFKITSHVAQVLIESSEPEVMVFEELGELLPFSLLVYHLGYLTDVKLFAKSYHLLIPILKGLLQSLIDTLIFIFADLENLLVLLLFSGQERVKVSLPDLFIHQILDLIVGLHLELAVIGVNAVQVAFYEVKGLVDDLHSLLEYLCVDL